ncbi:MAG: S8/S53 family peptidase, partial [Candidatus Heimdallarchaeota archaeon]|nr:S8/S53 family peptidase [Candidatus Heimdallarchaeota archaeon]
MSMRFFNVKIIVLNLVVLLVLLNSINLFMNISGYGINQLHVKFIEDNVNSIVDLNQLNEDFISYSETEGITCLDVNDAAVNSSKYNKLIYDPSLYNYLGINQIHKDLLNGITGYNKLSNKPVTVVIFDNLIDFNHNNLSRMIVTNSAGYDEIEWYSAVGKIVLLNDDSALPLSEKFIEIDSSSITSSELYDQNGYKYFSKYSLYDYLYVDYYSHGTSVAGIINQIAPGAQIISVAYPPDNNDVNVFYESVINFLDWLEIKGEEYNIKVVNISNRWGSNTFGEFAQNQRDVIEGKIMDLAKPKELSGEYSMVFTLSAGNTINQEGQENLVYPSHIANNYESQLYNSLGNDVVIENHFDYENNPAIATGIISVSSIYDFNTILHPIGTRNNAYVYDQDKKDDSTDLKLMAPGFNITTTFNTRNKVTNEPIDKPFASFTGTSAATPCVAGLVALLFSIDPNLEAYEVEKILSENAIYDINVELEGDELQQKYGLGMINPLATLANYDSTLNDFDGDGLLDVDELYYYHTNASNADSDFDGLTDYEELFEGSDGYITDPWDADSDDDSLSDSEEKYYQTNPNDPDTDHDWIVDPEELIQGEDGYITCPTNGDTDGDYLPDGWEVLHGYSPVSQ